MDTADGVEDEGVEAAAESDADEIKDQVPEPEPEPEPGADDETETEEAKGEAGKPGAEAPEAIEDNEPEKLEALSDMQRKLDQLLTAIDTTRGRLRRHGDLDDTAREAKKTEAETPAETQSPAANWTMKSVETSAIDDLLVQFRDRAS
ncbi:hypothetical protein [Jiella pelagia]|uniref:Uncharacterized protein n=1 Tax=Jiella pelagia TaxID=2986949 RepID=A0ABY7C9P6_9HYPH|nr:hypothetical protein [Jiella pelagia]WAP71500.1 hypothetical protein OH818_28160 [Jiella pelagia]